MLRSLVGSEMCIRDRKNTGCYALRSGGHCGGGGNVRCTVRNTRLIRLNQTLRGFHYVRQMSMCCTLPPVRIEERCGGDSQFKPKFKIDNNVEALRAIIIAGFSLRESHIFCVLPPSGGLLDVKHYDHGFKHSLKCENEQAMRAISVASSYYASNLSNAPFPFIRFAGVESLDV